MGTDNTQFHQRFRVWRRKSSELRRSAAWFPSGKDLKSEYSSKETLGYRNQEFSSKIRAEVWECRGSRVFRTPKSFVFAQRGREPSQSGLYFI